MGYTTDFYGYFELNKPLDEEMFNYLKAFSDTRRMKRDTEKLKVKYGRDFGIEGEFFVEGLGFKGQDDDETVIDHNTPPSTQPGLWCQWIPSNDKRRIVWDGGEKFYNADDWIIYIIDKILKPKGYLLNGAVAAKGESSDDFWVIKIDDNVVTIEQNWDNIVLKNGENDYDPYCLKMGEHYYVKVNDFSFEEKKEPTWSMLNDEEEYYKIVPFDSTEKAKEEYNRIRVRTLFKAPSKDGVEIEKISKYFILLNENTKVEVFHKEDAYVQPKFGILTDSIYDFENFSIRLLN